MSSATPLDFRGVSVTTATPFHADGSIDEASLRRQVAFLRDNGIRIMIPSGNTGEFTSLGIDEVKRVTALTVEEAGDDVLVLAGVGGSTPTAIELARAAQADGAEAVMIHFPSHTYISRTAIADYFLEIVEAIDIPVALYKRGPELPDDVLVELTRHERIAAVKYAVNDLPAFADVARDAQAAMFCGTAERWAPFYALAGAVGFTSGVANVVPRLSLALNDALESGDYATAMSLRDTLAPFEEARSRKFAANNVSVVKYALARMGLDSGKLRAPLTALDAADARDVDTILDRWAQAGHVELRTSA